MNTARKTLVIYYIGLIVVFVISYFFTHGFKVFIGPLYFALGWAIMMCLVKHIRYIIETKRIY